MELDMYMIYDKLLIFSQTGVDVQQTKNALQKIGEAVFDWRMLMILLICIVTSIVLGNIVASKRC